MRYACAALNNGMEKGSDKIIWAVSGSGTRQEERSVVQEFRNTLQRVVQVVVQAVSQWFENENFPD